MNTSIHIVGGLLTSAIVPIVVAALTSVLAFAIQERKLRAELRTEFMAEAAAKHLLSSPDWRKRSFDAIKQRLGGFTDDELRKILVRAGAVRFEGRDAELWGLVERNKGDL